MVERKWRVRLGAAAELDFANIIKWTTDNFGQRQSRVYRDVLIGAIGDLGDGPESRAPRREMRSCRVFARSTWLATAGAWKSLPDVSGDAGNDDRNRANPSR